MYQWNIYYDYYPAKSMQYLYIKAYAIAYPILWNEQPLQVYDNVMITKPLFDAKVDKQHKLYETYNNQLMRFDSYIELQKFVMLETFDACDS